jgi:hypothetical protein
MATATNWRNTTRALCAGVLVFSLAGTALAQNGKRSSDRNAPPDPNASLADRLLPHGKTKQWSMSVDVFYPGLRIELPPVDNFGVIRPGFAGPGRQVVTQAEWDRLVNQSSQGVKFDTAAMVFPVPLNSAAHISSMGTFKSWIKIDNIETPMTPQFTEGYQSGERLARWDLHSVDAKRLNLHLEIPVTCWETLFNEAEAMKVDWPKAEWPAAAKTALEPVYLVEWRDEEKEIAEGKALLDDLIKKWLNGRDPKSMKPVELAKELAGHVLEFCDPGAGTSVYGSSPDSFQGLRTRTVKEIVNAKRVYKLDPPVFLGAVYRNVGLPARTVYGLDMAEERGERGGGGNSEITAWTEFAVMDPKNNTAVWIPVDLVNLRRSGSRMQRMDRSWKYFGASEDLAYMIPISFHAHPPTGVVVRSLPAFWGWLCTPETPPLPHSVHIDAMSQSSRDKKRNAEEAAKNKGKKP